MRTKLAVSALVVAALFGATTLAAAQMQPAPGASSEGNVGPGATKSSTKKMKAGTTTGMAMKKGAMKKGNAVDSSAGKNSGAK